MMSSNNILQPPSKHAEKRVEREWDIEKSSDGDWSEHKHTRPPKRGGYSDGRRDRKDSHWGNNEDSDRKDHRSHGLNRRSGNSRGRHQDSNQRSPFYSQKANSYQRSNGRNAYRGKESFDRGAQNRNNSNGSSNLKIDNIKVWHGDEHNEAQNKQARLETWLSKQTITSEDISESDDSRKNDFSDDNDEDSNAKKHTRCHHKAAKYEKPTHKNSSSYNERQNQEKVHNSSDRDDKTGFIPLDKHWQRGIRNDYSYQSQNQHDGHSVRESDQRNYSRERFNKSEFKNKSSEYRNNKSSYSASKHQNYVDNNRSWKSTSENWKFQKGKVTSGTWSDNEGGIAESKTAWAGTGGTWSDQEDNDQAGPSKNIASGWGGDTETQVSDSENWNNPKSAVQNNDSLREGISSRNGQKFNQKSFDRVHHQNDAYKAYQNYKPRNKRYWKIQEPEASSEQIDIIKDEKKDTTESAKEDIHIRLLRMAYGSSFGKVTSDKLKSAKHKSSKHKSSKHNSSKQKSSDSDCKIIFVGKPESGTSANAPRKIQKCSDSDCKIIFVGKPESGTSANAPRKIQKCSDNVSQQTDSCEKNLNSDACNDKECIAPDNEEGNDQINSMEVGSEDKELKDEDITTDAAPALGESEMTCEVDECNYDLVLDMARNSGSNDLVLDVSRDNSCSTFVPDKCKPDATAQCNLKNDDILQNISSDALVINITENESKKIQLVSFDEMDKSCLEISEGISDTHDLLDDTEEIGLPSENFEKEASPQIKEVLPKHIPTELDVEICCGALTDDGDNGWSTVSDENGSDLEKVDNVIDTNVNKNSY